MEESIIINPETKYIAIEGPVGSGKTSLAKKLAEHLDGKLILEQPETNPFLENFYKDPRSNALPTELSFLFLRSNSFFLGLFAEIASPEIDSSTLSLVCGLKLADAMD